MNDMSISSWATLVALGAFHGINPGMGWLFAVSLGMQERHCRAVIRALLPLGIGHVLAVAAAIGVAIALGAIVPSWMLRWPVAALLVTLGVRRLFRHRHPRWASMRVTMRGLMWWSFLMATAHGAGLMVVPVFLGMTSVHAQGHACHTAAAGAELLPALVATGLHGTGYLAVTALVAILVFEKLGVGLLRKAWFNLDLLWAVALVLTGALTLVL
jgi:hypothetical protein